MTATGSDAKRLCDTLFTRPIPPDFGFSNFVVGDHLTAAHAAVTKRISHLSEKTAPSQVLVVTADNGNGKTLLANMIKDHLGGENEIRGQANTDVGCRFNYFFSHVKLHSADNSHIGYSLFQPLQFHLKWDSSYTYSLIAIRLFREFLSSYRHPWYVWLTNPLKWFVKAAVKTCDALLGGMLSDVLTEAGGELFDRANKAAQDFLAQEHTKDKFREFCNARKVGAIIADNYASGGAYTPPNRFNEKLFHTLENAQVLASAYDAIAEMREILSSVEAKVLVIIMDDANDLQILQNIARFIDGLDDLDRTEGPNKPRVLLLLNMVKSTYDAIATSDNPDKSLKHRILYNPPIVLPPPTAADIAALTDRIATLMNISDAGATRSRQVTAEERATIAQSCPRTSYREAIGHISESIRNPPRRMRQPRRRAG